MRRQNFRKAFFRLIGMSRIDFSGVTIAVNCLGRSAHQNKKPGPNEHRLFYDSIQLILLPEQ